MRSYPAFILRRVHKDSLKIFPNRNAIVKRWVVSILIVKVKLNE